MRRRRPLHAQHAMRADHLAAHPTFTQVLVHTSARCFAHPPPPSIPPMHAGVEVVSTARIAGWVPASLGGAPSGKPQPAPVREVMPIYAVSPASSAANAPHFLFVLALLVSTRLGGLLHAHDAGELRSGTAAAIVHAMRNTQRRPLQLVRSATQHQHCATHHCPCRPSCPSAPLPAGAWFSLATVHIAEAALFTAVLLAGAPSKAVAQAFASGGAGAVIPAVQRVVADIAARKQGVDALGLLGAVWFNACLFWARASVLRRREGAAAAAAAAGTATAGAGRAASKQHRE